MTEEDTVLSLVKPNLADLKSEISSLITNINGLVEDDFEFQERTRVLEKMRAVREQYQEVGKEFTKRCESIRESYAAELVKVRDPSFRETQRSLYETLKRHYELLALFNDVPVRPISEWEIPELFEIPSVVEPPREYARSPLAVKLSRVNHNNKYRYHHRAHLTISGAQRRISQLRHTLNLMREEASRRTHLRTILEANITTELGNIEAEHRKLNNSGVRNIWKQVFDRYCDGVREVFHQFHQEENIRHQKTLFNPYMSHRIQKWFVDDNAIPLTVSEDPHISHGSPWRTGYLDKTQQANSVIEKPISSLVQRCMDYSSASHMLAHPSIRYQLGAASQSVRTHDIPGMSELKTEKSKSKLKKKSFLPRQVTSEGDANSNVLVNLGNLNFMEDKFSEPALVTDGSVNNKVTNTVEMIPRKLSLDTEFDYGREPLVGKAIGMPVSAFVTSRMEPTTATFTDSTDHSSIINQHLNVYLRKSASLSSGIVSRDHDDQIARSSYIKPNYDADTEHQQVSSISSSNYDESPEFFQDVSPMADTETPDTPVDTIDSESKPRSSFVGVQNLA